MLHRYDFFPQALDYSAIDAWVKTTDEEAWVAARQVMRSEGLLVGGSSGSALAGTLQYLKSQEGRKNFGDVEGKNVVVLFPDGCVDHHLRNLKMKDQTKLTTMCFCAFSGYATIFLNHGSSIHSMLEGPPRSRRRYRRSSVPVTPPTILPGPDLVALWTPRLRVDALISYGLWKVVAC
jgi:hypothetical protein